jgi:mannose-6-phosphate isomerase-like protein (cupin superfamily)
MTLPIEAEVRYIFRGPGVGDWIWNSGGSVSGRPERYDFQIKARSADNLGAYSLMECTMPAGSAGPNFHVHTASEEAWYVLDGALTIMVEDDEFVAEPGSYFLVPRGREHTFHTYGTEACRFLLIFSPGRDMLWETLNNLRRAQPEGELDPDLLEAIFRQHREITPAEQNARRTRSKW